MKTVAERNTLFEADIVKGNLENAGFHPVVFDNSMNSFYPFTSIQGPSLVDIRVPDEEYEAAREWLDKDLSSTI
jgi:hypothetical protein